MADRRGGKNARSPSTPDAARSWKGFSCLECGFFVSLYVHFPCCYSPLLKIQTFSLFIVSGILELLLHPCKKRSAALAWTDGRGKGGGGGGGGLINNSFAAGRARGDPIPEPFLPSFQSTPFVSLTLSSFAIAAVVLPILPLLAFPHLWWVIGKPKRILVQGIRVTRYK